jgi:hypothetical protein
MAQFTRLTENRVCLFLTSFLSNGTVRVELFGIMKLRIIEQRI